MPFNSVQYFLFLTVVVALFWASPRRARPALIVVASLGFYAYTDWRYDILLVGTIGFTYWAGRALPTCPARWRRPLLVLSVMVSCSSLVLFKVAASAAFEQERTAGLLVPVGLSFYTFQAISYIVDIYRGQQEPERDIVVYGAYLAFFPHLLAGPIVRAKRLIPQLRSPRRNPKRVQFQEGLTLLFVGLFKKVAIADFLFGTIGDIGPQLLVPGSTYGAFAVFIVLVIGIIAMYFDIAGYIDMARGSAKLLGIEMSVNFLQPLTRARNFTDFWRRWQMTLQAWLRDYVFMPLRGPTRSNSRVAFAIFLTFLVAGLWHGLSFGWVFFGASISAILIGERFFNQRQNRRRAAGLAKPRRKGPLQQWLARLYVFGCLIVTFSWPITGNSVVQVITAVGALGSAGLGSLDLNLVIVTGYALAMLFLLDNFERRQTRAEGRPNPVTVSRAFGFALMLVAIVAFSGSTPREFTYFAF